MALSADTVFGTSYLTPEEFASAALMFGLQQSLPSDPDTIQGFLSAASRWLEAQTNKSYDPDETFTEQHDWDMVTRRIVVNNPPILSISSYVIYTGVSTFATFPTNSLAINNQLNYVELTSLTAAGNLTSMLLTMGLFQPYVQIAYKGIASVSKNIKLATGYLAAILINRSFLDQSMTPGIKSISVGGSTTITRADKSAGDNELPLIVRNLIAGEQEITVC